MKILHYALGFPPYRTGGLTKYSIDLMKSEIELGNEAVLLWPGRMYILKRAEVGIKQRDPVGEIENYELINPLPVPLLEGIKEINQYTKACDEEVYQAFLLKLKPDIIHIHTWMGLHREFVHAAKHLGIPMIYTAHDYFGICPKVSTLLHCDRPENCLDCPTCNDSALSISKIKLLQSPLYVRVKQTELVKKMRERYRSQNKEKKELSSIRKKNGAVKCSEYKRLRMYYNGMAEQMNLIHFNSTLTKEMFLKFCQGKRFAVKPITHGDIKDVRKKRSYKKRLRLGYLGSCSSYKKFDLLLGCLDQIYSKGKREFVLNVYSDTPIQRPYMRVFGSYQYVQLAKIFDQMDLLVVPSGETFGFVVIEALSYGVPVLLTERAGAKDVFPEGLKEFIVSGDAAAIRKRLEQIYEDRTLLADANACILKEYEVLTMEHHAREMIAFYDETERKQ